MPSQGYFRKLSLVASPRAGLNIYKLPVRLEAQELVDVNGMFSSEGLINPYPYVRIATSTPLNFYKQWYLGCTARGSFDAARTYAVAVSSTSLLQWRNGVMKTDTGPALNLGAAINADIVNGSTVVGDASTTLLMCDTDDTHIELDGAYRYVCGIGSYCVGAYLIGSNEIDPIKVGWSVPGDNEDWSGPGSGQITLADSLDEITGILNVRNNLVVGRARGLHVAQRTGVGEPAFRFDRVTKDSLGPTFPNTFVGDGTICLFTCPQGVYLFDMTELRNVSNPLTSTLFRDNAYNLRALIWQGRGLPGRYYVLYNQSGDCYIYNIDTNLWSRMDIPNNAYMYTEAAAGFPILYAHTGTYNYLYEVNTADTFPALRLVTRSYTNEDPAFDMRVYKVLLVYRQTTMTGDNIASLTVDYTHNNQDQQLTYTQTITTGDRVHRAWFPVDIVGHDFQFSLTMPEGLCEVYELYVDFSESGRQQSNG